MSRPAVHLPVRGEPDVTRAIMEATKLADALGFRGDQKSRIATAVSELARNIVKYADEGEIVMRPRESGRLVGLEVIAADTGPGIEDVERALEDHFSSGGTLGLGLPGVRRLMDDFELTSQPGEGTRVVATLWR